jgi:hypothetical protein
MSHELLTAAAGTGAIALMMVGINIIFSARGLWTSWFAVERRFRLRRFGGGWTHAEARLGRRGYFWIPKAIELRSPDDIHAYVLSDAFWTSPYAWFVRALCWYAGAMLVLLGLIVIALGLPSIP